MNATTRAPRQILHTTEKDTDSSYNYDFHNSDIVNASQVTKGVGHCSLDSSSINMHQE